MMPAQELVDQAFYIMLLYFLENSEYKTEQNIEIQLKLLRHICVVTAYGKIQLNNSDCHLLFMVPYYVQFHHPFLLPSSVHHQTMVHFASWQHTTERHRCT